MSKKKPVKKTSYKSSKKTPAKSKRTRGSAKKQDGSQFKLISIYVILGIIFLGYIFYHSTRNPETKKVNGLPAQELTE